MMLQYFILFCFLLSNCHTLFINENVNNIRFEVIALEKILWKKINIQSNENDSWNSLKTILQYNNAYIAQNSSLSSHNWIENQGLTENQYLDLRSYHLWQDLSRYFDFISNKFHQFRNKILKGLEPKDVVINEVLEFANDVLNNPHIPLVDHFEWLLKFYQKSRRLFDEYSYYEKIIMVGS